MPAKFVNHEQLVADITTLTANSLYYFGRKKIFIRRHDPCRDFLFNLIVSNKSSSGITYFDREALKQKLARFIPSNCQSFDLYTVGSWVLARIKTSNFIQDETSLNVRYVTTLETVLPTRNIRV